MVDTLSPCSSFCQAALDDGEGLRHGLLLSSSRLSLFPNLRAKELDAVRMCDELVLHLLEASALSLWGYIAVRLSPTPSSSTGTSEASLPLVLGHQPVSRPKLR